MYKKIILVSIASLLVLLAFMFWGNPFDSSSKPKGYKLIEETEIKNIETNFWLQFMATSLERKAMVFKEDIVASNPHIIDYHYRFTLAFDGDERVFKVDLGVKNVLTAYSDDNYWITAKPSGAELYHMQTDSLGTRVVKDDNLGIPPRMKCVSWARK